MQHSWPTCLIRHVAACQPRYRLTPIARVACRPVWGGKTINKREEGAQNSNSGLSSLQVMIFWRILPMSLWTAVSLTFPSWLPSWVSLQSGSSHFVPRVLSQLSSDLPAGRACTHLRVLRALRVCSSNLSAFAFLSTLSFHSCGCMLAWGAIVQRPTQPVASDVGGGLCCHGCLQNSPSSCCSSSPLVEMSEWSLTGAFLVTSACGSDADSNL